MNLFDIIVILLILCCGVIGAKRGVVQQVVSLVGTVTIFTVAYVLKGPLANLLMRFCPFFDFLGKWKGLVVLNVILYQIIAYAITIAILLAIFHAVLKMTGALQKLIDFTIILEIPSKILGFLAGLFEGYIGTFLILAIVAIPLGVLPLFQESNVSHQILYSSPILSTSLGGFPKAIKDIYKTTEDTIKTKEEKNELNLEVMNILLKYDAVSKEDIEKLMKNTNKLDSIKDLDDLIKKY